MDVCAPGSSAAVWVQQCVWLMSCFWDHVPGPGCRYTGEASCPVESVQTDLRALKWADSKQQHVPYATEYTLGCLVTSGLVPGTAL